jgi:hypothetical protein
VLLSLPARLVLPATGTFHRRQQFAGAAARPARSRFRNRQRRRLHPREAGSRSPMRIAITTRSSMKVKPWRNIACPPPGRCDSSLGWVMGAGKNARPVVIPWLGKASEDPVKPAKHRDTSRSGNRCDARGRLWPCGTLEHLLVLAKGPACTRMGPERQRPEGRAKVRQVALAAMSRQMVASWRARPRAATSPALRHREDDVVTS